MDFCIIYLILPKVNQISYYKVKSVIIINIVPNQISYYKVKSVIII